MRRETQAIIIFLLIETATMLAIGYTDWSGYWITDLIGSAMILTVGSASYNLVFLVPLIIGIVICAAGLLSRNIYVDYAVLGVGAGFIASAALQLFPLLLAVI